VPRALQSRRDPLAAQQAKGAPPADAALAAEFARGTPERYLAVTSLESAARHLGLWREARRSGFAAELHRPPSGEAVLTLAAPDRPGLLALFSAALASNGIDILSAEVASLAGGIALDQFHVREPGGGPPAQRRWENARADLLRLLHGEDESHKLVQRRLRRASWAASAAPEVQTRLRIDNLSSAQLTVLDVFTQDRPGLLYALAEAIHAAGASIELARIATEGNKATDAFYLREARPGAPPAKIVDPQRLADIERLVTEAIAAHAQRAG
jgi:[protein-PII] uridylyltransferase